MSDVEPPPVHAPPTQAGAIPLSPPSHGLAVASMVIGIVAVCGSLVGFFCFGSFVGVIMGITGLVLGWVSLAKRRPGRGMAWAGVITSAIAVLAGAAGTATMIYFITGGVRSARVTVAASKSQIQAQQIGQALLTYATDNKGALPPQGSGWERSLSQYVLTQGVFVSPNNAGAGGGGAATPSYIYVGPATLVSDPQVVLAYENPALNAQMYAVIYADGHVAGVTKPELDAIIAALPKSPAPAGSPSR